MVVGLGRIEHPTRELEARMIPLHQRPGAGPGLSPLAGRLCIPPIKVGKNRLPFRAISKSSTLPLATRWLTAILWFHSHGSWPVHRLNRGYGGGSARGAGERPLTVGGIWGFAPWTWVSLFFFCTVLFCVVLLPNEKKIGLDLEPDRTAPPPFRVFVPLSVAHAKRRSELMGGRR